MRKRFAIAGAVLALAVVIPVAATAVTGTPDPAASQASAASIEVTRSAPAAGSKVETRTYDLDFTLPTAGKSGCLVCHGDPNLISVGTETTSSIYVDFAVLQSSAHAENTPCTGCHLNFAYTAPHTQAEGGEDWISAARLACKNCHTPSFTDYANGVHSLAGEPGVSATQTLVARREAGKPERVPLCGDCHGGHRIPAADDKVGQRALFLSGIVMCGQCHEAEADSYDDYYHGRAYRRGSLDAPSCWDCHGYHKILPSSDRLSPTHPNQLAITCGQADCHDGADETFIEYAELIHGHGELRDANPIVSIVGSAKEAVRGAIGAVRALF